MRKEIGEENKAIEITKKLLKKGLDVVEISDVTRLTMDRVMVLQTQYT